MSATDIKPRGQRHGKEKFDSKYCMARAPIKRAAGAIVAGRLWLFKDVWGRVLHKEFPR